MSAIRIVVMLIVFLALLGFTARSSYGGAPRQRLDDALLSASRKGSTRKIKSLLVKGANPNVHDVNGNTPLMLLLQSTCYTGMHVSKQQYHSDGTITIDMLFASGEVPASAPGTDALKALLRRGANVNGANYQRDTPLMFAADLPTMDCFKLLLAHGGDIHASDADGSNILLWAAGQGHTQMLALLLSKGLAPNVARISDGVTPLLLEASGGNVGSVKILLNHGANTYAVDKNGKTALQYAKEIRNTPVVKLLMPNMPL